MTQDTCSYNKDNKEIFHIEEEDEHMRLDVYLFRALEKRHYTLSRNLIKNLIKKGFICCILPENKSILISEPDYRVKNGDNIEFYIRKESNISLEQQLGRQLEEKCDTNINININFDILFEDEDIMVINKPRGMVVHPAPGHHKDTLVHALGVYMHQTKQNYDFFMRGDRPGIVHRLDKDTSGIMVVAKNDFSFYAITKQFLLRHQGKNENLKRVYEAFVWGKPPMQKGIIETFLGRDPHNRERQCVKIDASRDKNAKKALTHFSVEKTLWRLHSGETLAISAATPLFLNNFVTHGVQGTQVVKKYQRHHNNFAVPLPLPSPLLSLVRCKLETGRTHQIRVHMNHIKCPLIQDPVYGLSMQTKINKLHDQQRSDVLSLKGQALHACHFSFCHPRTNKQMTFNCPMPHDMYNIYISLGFNKT